MNFTELTVNGFGNLTGSFQFKPGLNIIHGPNEVGKSTLQQALIRSLYGFYTGPRITPNEREQLELMRPWHGESYGLTVKLSSAAQRELIASWRFDEYGLQLRDGINGEDLTDQVLGKGRNTNLGSWLLGMGYLEFKQICCLDQARITPLGGSDSITQLLQQAVEAGSGERSVEEAVQRIHSERRERLGLRKGARSALPNRAVAVWQQRLAELEDQQQQARALQSEIAQAASELDLLNTELVALETGKGRGAPLDEDQLLAIRADLKQLQRSQVALAVLEQRANDQQFERQTLAAEREQLEQQLAKEAETQQPKLGSRPLLIAAAAAVICMLLSVITPLLLVTLLLPLTYLAVQLRKGKGSAVEHAQSQQAVGERLLDVRARINELEQTVQQLEQARQQQQQAEQAVAADLTVLEIEFHSPEQAERELNLLTKGDRDHDHKQVLINQRSAELKSRIETLAEQLPNLPELTAEIEQLTERIDRAQEVGDALLIAAEQLTQAAHTVRRNIAPPLQERLDRYLSTITAGRYSKAKVDQQLDVTVEVPETGELIPLQQLSRGTQDQVLLTQRLAITDLLTNADFLPPLLLDDCFVHYDSERLNFAYRMLMEESKYRQVLLFVTQPPSPEIVETLDACNWIELYHAASLS